MQKLKFFSFCGIVFFGCNPRISFLREQVDDLSQVFRILFSQLEPNIVQHEKQRLDVVFFETCKQMLDQTKYCNGGHTLEQEKVEEAVHDVFNTTYFLSVQLGPERLHNMAKELRTIQSV